MTSRSASPDYSPLAIGIDLAPLPTYKAATTTSISFGALLDPPLQLHEDLSKGCGGQLWPAGMVLGKHMLRYQREVLKDARMCLCLLPRQLHSLMLRSLELGAGGGLVGLGLALACDFRHPLLLTDQENMIALMGENIALNGVGSRVTPLVLNW